MNQDARIWELVVHDESVDAAQESARRLWELAIQELLPLHADLRFDAFRFYMTGQNGRTVLYPARWPFDSNRWVRGAISMNWQRMESVYAEVDHIDPARRAADGEWLDEDEWAQRAEAADVFVIHALESTYPDMQIGLLQCCAPWARRSFARLARCRNVRLEVHVASHARRQIMFVATR